MRNDAERLTDILEAITNIEKYAVKGKAEFQKNELIQIWIVHHLQIIGEASNNLSQEIREKYPNLSWAEIIAFRNILVHEYFRIDLNVVWKIVERDLPNLKTKIELILEENSQ